MAWHQPWTWPVWNIADWPLWPWVAQNVNVLLLVVNSLVLVAMVTQRYWELIIERMAAGPRPKVTAAGTTTMLRRGELAEDDSTERRPRFNLWNKGAEDWTEGHMVMRAGRKGDVFDMPWHVQERADAHGAVEREMTVGLAARLVEGVYEKIAARRANEPSPFRTRLTIEAGAPPLPFSIPPGILAPGIKADQSYWLWIRLWRGTNRRFLFRVSAHRARARRVRIWNPLSWRMRLAMRAMDR